MAARNRKPKPVHDPLRPVTKDQKCFERAIQRGQPTFTLVGQDRTAPAIIRTWALEAARNGAPAEKVGQALIDSVTFEAWQLVHGSKIPD